MSLSAWVWLIILFIILWVIPISLYFYQPKREISTGPDWEPAEYEELKFNRTAEIIIIIISCLSISWLVWLGVSAGVLVWK